MSSSNSLWYVSVGDNTVGPVSTDLVVKGIEHRKIPTEALVRAADGTTWVSMASISVFHAAVVRSYPPPPPDSDEARLWLMRGFSFPRPQPLPRPSSLPTAAAPAGATADEVPIDIDWADATAVDWSRSFCGYFLVQGPVELPSEDALITSLRAARADVFLEDEALWNVALCLVYGSDPLAKAVTSAFLASISAHGRADRLEWMRRTLLGTGFVPSGLPAAAGRRAFERLAQECPPGLAPSLQRSA